ncbi:MAG: hypothetical protein KDA60_14515, partial [Planctomycetales bacterium]|nr:hypothetical protein [Planctomycetales bacterium]
KQVIAHLGERVTLITDVRQPVTPQSERLLVAISLANEAALAKSIDRIMETDPNAQKIEFDDHIIWEITPEDDEFDELPVLTLDDDFVGADSDFFDDEFEEEEEGFLTAAAISVAKGHLLISSHVDFIEDILARQNGDPKLADTQEFKDVEKLIDALGVGEGSSGRSFIRLDEAARGSYELLRQGLMPESEGLIGKALNRVFGPEEKGMKREQKIDGSKLPPFDQIEDFFRSGGLYIHTEQDGWSLAGGILAAVEAEATSDSGPALSTAANEDAEETK